jgi:hypothetical protein
VARARRRLGAAQPYVWTGSGLELALAVVGALLAGLHGLCAGWLVAVWFEALVMARSVYRAARTP